MIEAWFSNEIPLSYGPIGYGGLPGLILELQVGKSIFVASKMIFKNQTNLKIKKPEVKKEITEKEFEELTQKMLRDFKKSVKKKS